MVARGFRHELPRRSASCMNTPENRSARDLRELVLQGSAPRLKAGRRLLLGTGMLLLVLLAAYGLTGGKGEEGPHYRTQVVDRGELVIQVSATGNLQPTNSVEEIGRAHV